MTTVKVKLLTPTAKLPAYQTDGAAGMDLCADCDEFTLWAGERRLIGTGIAVEIPAGFEGQVRPRSGAAIKHGVTVLNAPGCVDPDYRGEVCVILINHGDCSVQFKRGERIAQMVIAPVVRATIEQVGELSSTERGAGAFGSTGK